MKANMAACIARYEAMPEAERKRELRWLGGTIRMLQRHKAAALRAARNVSRKTRPSA